MNRLCFSGATLALLLGLVTGAAAGESAALVTPSTPSAAYPGELPPAAAALAAIHQAPLVRAAEAVLRAEKAQQEKLEAGPHEWTARFDTQRRRVSAPEADPAQRYREWTVGLERTLRLPGKAGADAALGEQGVRQAGIAADDARHESGRLLLQLWFAWLRERETAAQWAAQTALLAKERAVVARRLELGDAARRELALAEAALAQAEAESSRSEARREQAGIELSQRFPTLPLPAQLILSVPQPVVGTLADWREATAAQQHELRLARADSERYRLLARRADSERLPDPTLGLHVANEFGGSEKIVGLALTIPLPGAARAAAARAQSAYADAAGEREQAVLAKVEAEIAGQYARATAAWASWRRAEDAAERMMRSAELTVRAQQLGEAALAEVLLARRQAHEARLAAQLARLDALESGYRLQLDAHRLWADDDDDDHAHEH